MICSFDIFDTCLVRGVLHPHDVFYFMGVQLSQFPDLQGLDPTAFVKLRVHAERSARENSPAGEVTLEQIWNTLQANSIIHWPLDINYCQLEQDWEERLLFPVVNIISLIRRQREVGNNIIFVSDMYLPSHFLKSLLKKYGMYLDGDKVYVSCEHNANKQSGQLFKLILHQEHIEPKDMLHRGDNRHSDLTVPKSLGIKTEFICHSTINCSEKRILSHVSNPFFASLFAGTSRAWRLSHNSLVKNTVALLNGPVSLLYADWLLKEASTREINRLYFFARDGYLLKKVAEEVRTHNEPDCQYLQVSRQSLNLPSSNGTLPVDLHWIKRDIERAQISRLLKKLEIPLEECPWPAHTILNTKSSWKAFWQWIATDRIQARLKTLIKKRRNTAIAYLRSKELFNSEQWAVVDLGWFLTTQKSLRTLVKTEDPNREVQGLYLELRPDRNLSDIAGPAHSFFDERKAFFKWARPSTNCTLIEHLLSCADHNSVHHYEMHNSVATPVYNGIPNPKLNTLYSNLRSDTLAFAKKCRWWRTMPIPHEEKVRLFEAIFTSVYWYPEMNVVRELEDLTASSDQNNEGLEKVVRPLSLKQAILPMIPQRWIFKRLWAHYEPVWIEGSRAISSPHIRIVSWLALNSLKAWMRFKSRISPEKWRALR